MPAGAYTLLGGAHHHAHRAGGRRWTAYWSLDSGADDYVQNPSARAVVARVKAICVAPMAC